MTQSQLPLLEPHFFFFFEMGSHSVAQAGVQFRDSVHCSLRLSGSSDPPTSASRIAGSTRTHNHTRVGCVFLVQTGFHHVAQAGLKLLSSGDLPTASASQVAGTTGMHHHACLTFFLFFFLFFVETGSCCVVQAGLELWPQAILLPRPPKVLGL